MRFARYALLVLLPAFVVGPALRAEPNDILIGNVSTGTARASSSVTFSHTIGSGTNRYLVVSIAISNSSVVDVTNPPRYGGVAMTLIGAQSSTGNNERIEMWQLIAPAVGTANVVVNLTGSADIVAGAISFFGVHQTTPHGAFVSNIGQNATATLDVPTATREMVLDSLVTAGGASSLTASAAQTEQWNLTTGNGTVDNFGAGSTTPAAFGTVIGGVLTVQESWTLAKTRRWAIGGISIKFAATPTAVSLVEGTAAPCGDTTQLRWTTGLEADNVGFRIVREESDGRMTTLPGMVAGSLFMTGPQTLRNAARTYRWTDRTATPAVRYWLDDVDTRGRTRRFGPLLETNDSCSDAAAPPSPTVGSLAAQRTLVPAVTSAGGGKSRSVGTGRSSVTQLGLAAGAAVKIEADREGWYRVPQPRLVAAGLNPDVDPRTLRLYADGAEQAISVTGEEDGTFGPSDAVEFYGTGQDTSWSGSRIYWLVAGTGAGRRIDRRDAPSAGNASVSNYPFTVERHDRSVYAAEIRNGDADNFFGPVISDTTATQQFLLPHLDRNASSDATLTLALQGVAGDPGAAGDHQVTVALNGHPAGVVTFATTEAATRTLSLPLSSLVAGENEVALTSSGPGDISAVVSLRLTYPHTYDADGDALLFSAPAGQPVVVHGFTSDRVRVLDTTAPSLVRELRATVTPSGSGFAVSLIAPGPGTRTLLAITDPLEPLSVTANRPSSWTAASNEGVVAILTTAALAPSLEPLRAKRAAEFGSAVIIDVADLYDELSYGAKDPAAIRDFVRASRGWKVAPRFLILAGDASFDPRGYLGQADGDVIPTHFVTTSYIETASDDWFADLDGDGAADVPIGRLPVRTPAEASSVVEKILGYQAQEAGAPWTHRAVVVTDGNAEIAFDPLATGIATLLAPAYDVERMSASTAGASSVHTSLLGALNAGAGILAYFGHGSVQQWSEQHLLGNADVAALQNGTKLPFVMAMTCLDAFFQDAYSTSLAEALVNAPGGGAIAVWTSSGLTPPEQQTALAEAMTRLLVAGDTTLGEAAVEAKKATPDADVRATWILLGDPSIRLR